MREGDGVPPPPPPPPPSERAGATKETRKSDTASSPSTKTPASTLTSVPPAAARALCASLLHRVMPMVIEDASHWTVRGRRRAVWLLCSLVRYAGQEVTPYMPQLLNSLGESSRWVRGDGGGAGGGGGGGNRGRLAGRSGYRRGEV